MKLDELSKQYGISEDDLICMLAQILSCMNFSKLWSLSKSAAFANAINRCEPSEAVWALETDEALLSLLSNDSESGAVNYPILADGSSIRDAASSLDFDALCTTFGPKALAALVVYYRNRLSNAEYDCERAERKYRSTLADQFK